MKCYSKFIKFATLIVIFYCCFCCFGCSAVVGVGENRHGDLVCGRNADRWQFASKITDLIRNGFESRTDLEPDLVEGRKKVQGRLFFKMIKRFIRRNLLKVLLAALVAIGVIKLLITFVLPFFFGVHTAKKIFLKILLFFIPAAGYLFKLCSAYDGHDTKTKFHKHHHIISQPPLAPAPLPSLVHKPFASPVHSLHQSLNEPYSHSHYHSRPLLAPAPLPAAPIGPYLYGNFKDPEKFKHFLPDDGPSYDSYQPMELDDFDPEKWTDKELDLNLDVRDEMDLDRLDVKNENEIAKHLPVSMLSLMDDSQYDQKSYPKPKRVKKPKVPLTYNNLPPQQQQSQQQALYSNRQIYLQKLLNKQRNRFVEPHVSQSNEHLDNEYDDIVNEADNPNRNRNSNRNIDSQTLKTFDEPYYGPIMDKIDDIFRKIGFNDDNCRKRLICSMYKAPELFSPYSNYVSHQLSRDLNDLQVPLNAEHTDVIKFFEYMQAARDGQNNENCLAVYRNCSLKIE